MRLPLSFCALSLLCSIAFSAEPPPTPLEITDGDCILLLGDTLLERENNYGHLETVLNKSLSTDLDTVQFILKLIKGAYLRPE